MARIVVRRLVILAVRVVKEFNDDRCSQTAASLAYYGLLTLFPLLIVAVSDFGLFIRDATAQQQVVEKVLDVLPLTRTEGRQQVEDAVAAVGRISLHLSLLGFVLTLWSVSGLFRSIRSAFATVWQEPADSLMREKLADFFLMAGAWLFLLASILATGFFHRVQATHSGILGPLSGGSLLWRILPHLFSLGWSFIAFLLLYRFVPRARLWLGDVWPGAAAAAGLFEIVKQVFSVYAVNFGRYDVVYGSLGAAVLLLTSMYLYAAILLMGAYVVKAYPPVMLGQEDGSWDQLWHLDRYRFRLRPPAQFRRKPK